MAKIGTVLNSDRHLLIEALTALEHNKPHVVKDHIEKVLVNMAKMDSYTKWNEDI